MRAIVIVAFLLVSCGADESVPMPEFGWESIGSSSSRLEVPGGWVVRTSTGYGAGISYVPDPNKEWRK